MKSFILSIPKGVPTIIMLVLVAYFTLATNPFGINALRIFPYAKQLGHFILYFVVALVFIMDYAKGKLPHHSKINHEIALATVAAVLSFVMELVLMWWTDGYYYDITNVYAAWFGALVAFLFYHYWLYHPFRHYLYHSVQHHWRYQHRRKKKKDIRFKL
jgi:hypothetical protein